MMKDISEPLLGCISLLASFHMFTAVTYEQVKGSFKLLLSLFEGEAANTGCAASAGDSRCNSNTEELPGLTVCSRSSIHRNTDRPATFVTSAQCNRMTGDVSETRLSFREGSYRLHRGSLRAAKLTIIGCVSILFVAVTQR